MSDSVPETVPDIPNQAPPRPGTNSTQEYLYLLKDNKPVIIGKVFVDQASDAWIRIDAEGMAAEIGVENIDGVALLDHATFVALDTE